MVITSCDALFGSWNRFILKTSSIFFFFLPVVNSSSIIWQRVDGWPLTVDGESIVGWRAIFGEDLWATDDETCTSNSIERLD